MTGKQLRNSILQWAIQGKLVPQDPNDEPASVLLERIRVEKARLVKEKKIKRDKNESIIFRGEDNSYYEKLADGTVRCIDSEIPFDIPDNWAWCRVCNIFILNPKNNNEDEDMAAFIPMEMIDACYGSSFLYKEVKWKSIKNGYTHFSDGDIAFAKITPCFQNRKSAVFENLPNGIGAGTTELKVLRPYANTVNPYYLLFFLETPCFVEEASFKGTANQQRIISGYLESKLFPLPSKAEQDRIVKQIQQLLPLTNKYEFAFEAHLRQQNSINSLLKKSILQEAIQGRLVPQIESEGTAEELLAEITEEKKRLVKEGKLKKSALTASRIFRGDDNRYRQNIDGEEVIIDDKLPFEIPDTWRWIQLGDMFLHNTGKALNGIGTTGSLRKYITTSNVYWNSFDFSKIKEMRFTDSELEKCTVTKNDILVCEGGDIGRTAIWLYDYEVCIQNHIHRLRPIVSIEPMFFYYVMRLYKYMGLIGGKGIGIQGLSSGALHRIIIPLPPIQEQRRIVDKIESVAGIMSR